MSKLALEGENSILEFPDHEEDLTLVFNSSFPIDTIFIGRTYPFPMYRINRRERAGRHLFEYVQEGRGEIVIDGKKQLLSAGDTFFLSKGSEQSYLSDPSDPLSKIWVSVRSEYIDKMLETYGVTTGVYRANVAKKFRAIIDIAGIDSSPGDKFFVVADTIHEIITELSRSKLASEQNIISVIKNELVSSVYSRITLDALAAKLFISKSQLIRIFKRAVGVTPYQYLLGEKLSVARELLSSTQMSVKTVSDLLCFTDEHYFSYLFKQKTGKSPREYRRDC